MAEWGKKWEVRIVQRIFDDAREGMRWSRKLGGVRGRREVLLGNEVRMVDRREGCTGVEGSETSHS